MSARRRAALPALLAVTLLGFGLTVDTARAGSVPVRDSRVVAHGARVAPSTAAPSERRAPSAKAGVLAVSIGATASWVHALAASAAVLTAAVLPAATRSRAPPA